MYGDVYNNRKWDIYSLCIVFVFLLWVGTNTRNCLKSSFGVSDYSHNASTGSRNMKLIVRYQLTSGQTLSLKNATEVRLKLHFIVKVNIAEKV